MRSSKYIGVLLFALCALLFTSPVRADITTGLVGWWKLDDGSGTSAADSAGSNNGTLANSPSTPTWTSTSKIGPYALSFDGNDYVSTALTTAFGDFTACAWFKSSADSGAARIIDKAYDTGFWLGHDVAGTANKWGGGVLEASSPYGIYVTLTNGTWHHICSVRSGTTHTIYGDGGAVSASNTVSSSALDATAVYFGAAGGSTAFFTGSLDEVRIYNRALTADDVTELYNYTGGGATCSGGLMMMGVGC